jgi:hypothetical protein
MQGVLLKHWFLISCNHTQAGSGNTLCFLEVAITVNQELQPYFTLFAISHMQEWAANTKVLREFAITRMHGMQNTLLVFKSCKHS